MIAHLTAVLIAQALAAGGPPVRPYDAQHYRIDIRLENDGAFTATTTATVLPRTGGTRLEFDAYALEFKSAQVADVAAKFEVKANPASSKGTVTVTAAKPFAAGKPLQVKLTYTGHSREPHEGFFSVPDPTNPDALPWFFTQFEASHAQRFFPCNDQPGDKATTELFAIVDARYQVISNGPKILDETFTEGGKNLRRVHHKLDKPHPTYAVALAVGPFETIPVTTDVPGFISTRAGVGPRLFTATDAMRDSLPIMKRLTGVAYPWPTLHLVAVPHFYWSGMENTATVFARESKLVLDATNEISGRARIAGLLFHEIAHQWFGDDVTLKWWDDTWLNEGFASYFGNRMEDAWHTERVFKEPNDLAEIERAESTFVWYTKMENGPRARPLKSASSSGVDDGFDAVSYRKGAAVLTMLHTWLGEDLFKAGVKAYLEKHAYGNATADDFFAAIGTATKKGGELKAFKDAWLTRKGYPVVTPEATYANNQLTVTIRQKPNRADEKGTFVFKLPIVLHRQKEPKFDKREVITVDKPVVTVKIAATGAPEWINWNEDGSALTVVTPTSISEDQRTMAARYDPDPVWRVLSAWALASDYLEGDAASTWKPSDAAMGALLDVLLKDPSPYVRASLLHRLADSKRPKLPGDLGEAVLSLAKVPQGLKDDDLGFIRVRRAAIQLLGKLDYTPGHNYVLQELNKKELDLNLIQAFSLAAGHIGTNLSLGALRAAMTQASERSETHRRHMLEGVGAYPGPEGVSLIEELLLASRGDHELGRVLLDRVETNAGLKQTPEFAAFVSRFVLAGPETGFGEVTRSDAIQLLDEVKTDAAKTALTEISTKSSSDHLKSVASASLKANFPPAAAAPKKR